MQLPGMSTDAVRLSLDVTWDPLDGTFSMSRRLWTRDPSSSTWQLEDMACSGTPIPWEHLRDRWAGAADESFDWLNSLVEVHTDPF